MNKILLLLLTVLLSGVAYARDPKVKTVVVDFIYQIHPRESLEEARLKAIQQAQLEGIKDAFDTALSQTNFSSIYNSNSGGDERFYSFAESDVNGQWVETISEDVKINSQGGMNFYNVQLKGKVRELISNRIDVDWALMSNGTDPKKDKVRNDTFTVGEYFRLLCIR